MDIEKYLKNNQDRMDVEKPEEGPLWEGIRKELITGDKSFKFQFWNYAAILILLLSLAYGFYSEINRRSDQKYLLSRINQTLGDIESGYRREVADKSKAANLKILKNQPDNEIIVFLIKELEELDSLYDEALTDLNTNGYREQTVNIIFDNYEKRIKILEQLILETHKNENQNNKIKKVIL